MANRPPRSQLDHVLLGSTPGERSRWAQATGRTYDIRVDEYGPQSYAVTVNIDRVGPGTVGWICHRDGGLGALAGLIIFRSAEAEVEPDTGISYLPGIIWPLPRDYWVDGGRLMVRGWVGAPFKTGPSQFKNGFEVKPDNRWSDRWLRTQRYRRRHQRILQRGPTDHRRRHTSELHRNSRRSADSGRSLHEDRDHLKREDLDNLTPP